MTTRIRPAVIALAVAAAFAASPVLAVQGVKFDPAGLSGIGVGVKDVVWEKNPVLFQGAMGVDNAGHSAAALIAGVVTVFSESFLGYFYGQGQMTSAKDAAGVATIVSPTSDTFTYTFKVPVSVAWTSVYAADGSILSQTSSVNNRAVPDYLAGDNYFKIFHNSAPSVNETLGTGYSVVTEILEGRIDLNASTLGITGFTLNPIGDAGGTTSQGGVPIFTVTASGNATLQIEQCDAATAADLVNVKCKPGGGAFAATTLLTEYFRSDIDGLTIDINMSPGYSAPFVGKLVPAAINGVTPFFGTAVAGQLRNNSDCDGVVTTPGFSGCDLIASGTAGTMTFNGTFLPEPGSMAILGLGLGVMGFFVRRKRQVA